MKEQIFITNGLLIFFGVDIIYTDNNLFLFYIKICLNFSYF